MTTKKRKVTRIKDFDKYGGVKGKVVRKKSGVVKLKSKKYETQNGKLRKVGTTKAKLSKEGEVTGTRKYTKFSKQGKKKKEYVEGEGWKEKGKKLGKGGKINKTKHIGRRSTRDASYGAGI